MRRTAVNISIGLSLCFSFLCSCTVPIPTAEKPVLIEKRFKADSERAWEAVNLVVQRTQGVLITADKSAGFIVYSLKDPPNAKVYMQVHILPAPRPGEITVRLIARSRSGAYTRDKLVDHEFFTAMQSALEGR